MKYRSRIEPLNLLLRLLEEESCTNEKNSVLNSLKVFKEILVKTLNLEPELIQHEYPSLMGIIEGKNKDNFIVLLGHIDVLCDELMHHSKNSHKIIQVDDDVIIMGRGASDMKGGLVSLVLTLDFILERNSKPPVNIIYYVMSDEEQEGESITDLIQYIKKHNNLNSFKGVILFEPTDAYWFVIGNLNYIGTQLLIMNDERNNSRITDNIKKKVELWSLELKKKISPHVLQKAFKTDSIEGILEIINTSKRYYSNLLGSYINEAFEGVLTEVYGFRKLRNGMKICALDIISLLYDINDVTPLLHELKEDQYVHDIFIYDYRKLTVTDPHTELCLRLKKWAKNILGFEVKPLVSLTAGPDVVFRMMGIPTISFGPGYIINLHSNNEIVSLRNIVLVAKIISGLILTWY